MLWPWQRLQVRVVVRGIVGRRMVRWAGAVSVHPGATLADVLRRAGRACGADLAQAALNSNPILLLDGDRVEVPEGLLQPVHAGAEITWLMTMSGG